MSNLRQTLDESTNELDFIHNELVTLVFAFSTVGNDKVSMQLARLARDIKSVSNKLLPTYIEDTQSQISQLRRAEDFFTSPKESRMMEEAKRQITLIRS